MQPWIWIAAWLAINVAYVMVAIWRARPARSPPAHHETATGEAGGHARAAASSTPE